MGKPISPKKRKYLNNRAKGMTKKDAALAAGYSATTAMSVSANIETPDVRAAFAELVREKIPARKIVKRIDEGLDAMKTEFFQKDGIVTDQRDVIAWNERRMYASLAAEYGGYFVPPKQESADQGTKILIQFIRDKETPQIQVAQQPQLQER